MWLISLNKISCVFGTGMVMGLSWCSDSRDTETLTSYHVHSVAGERLNWNARYNPSSSWGEQVATQLQRFLCPPYLHGTCLATKNRSLVCGIILPQQQEHLASHWHFIPPLSCRLSACSPTHSGLPPPRESLLDQRHSSLYSSLVSVVSTQKHYEEDYLRGHPGLDANSDLRYQTQRWKFTELYCMSSTAVRTELKVMTRLNSCWLKHTEVYFSQSRDVVHGWSPWSQSRDAVLNWCSSWRMNPKGINFHPCCCCLWLPLCCLWLPYRKQRLSPQLQKTPPSHLTIASQPPGDSCKGIRSECL